MQISQASTEERKGHNIVSYCLPSSISQVACADKRGAEIKWKDDKIRPCQVRLCQSSRCSNRQIREKYFESVDAIVAGQVRAMTVDEYETLPAYHVDVFQNLGLRDGSSLPERRKVGRVTPMSSLSAVDDYMETFTESDEVRVSPRTWPEETWSRLSTSDRV